MSDTAIRSATPSALFRPGGLAGPALLSAHFVSGGVFFAFGLAAVVEAWARPEYGHGPVIPLLSAYMFLRELKQVPPSARPVTDRWPGLLVIVAALLIALVGHVATIADLVAYGFILWLFGTLLVLFGARRGWYFWPSVLHLVFMLPLPQFVYWPVSLWLQGVSSELGVSMIQAVGVPVILEGNIIDLGIYELQVEEACSGLRYLFPVMSFSYVFSVLYTGPVWHKAVLLLAAAPLTVLMNAFRIAVIGVLVDNFGTEHAEGFLHAFEGWVIFVACITLLFLLAVLLRRLQGQREHLADAIDLDFSNLRPQFARFLAVPATAALGVAVGLTALAAAGQTAIRTVEAQIPERRPLALLPGDIDGWRAWERRVHPRIAKALDPDDMLHRTYHHAAERTHVALFIAYYADQSRGKGIHSPEVCLPAMGWEVADFSLREVTTAAGQSVPLVRAIVRREHVHHLVYYWFEQRGRRTGSDYEAKALAVWDKVTRGRTDGALVRLITEIGPGEPVAAADARLQRFVDRLVPRLGVHMPE
ncbi:MAG: VPLPA-CTERM-specific exosortase XrtD [Paracoccaceae bacterium]